MDQIINKNPKISIITVVKNGEKHIENNIKSLINQKFKNFEHIVIDGGSTDSTNDILKKYKNYFSYYVSEKDNGLYDAMNKGIVAAKGDIIGVLNSDDIYYPETLDIVKKYFEENPDLDFLFGSVFKYKLLSGYYPKKIFWTFGFYTAHSVGFFIKKKSQERVGFYNTKYKYSADYDLFYRMIVKFKMKGMATKKDEIFGVFHTDGFSYQIRFIDYLIENSVIRIDNGQNKIIVLLIFLIRFIKNFSTIVKQLGRKKI
jgi:glycosyltransferase involved in cell wall biosynthesis